ncbi:MAG: hypothetical protein A2W99_03915 [Bacteroidetes bacterium GWF2_33_16]|nr:MAG: hypothetical protein A2X00_07130 [Bacteroidetes bacterium GWE2_32_14]OFY02938.1 MAG: hypothetical protein A2W99_03915 [Bacteroidetes bacterium GWF2_33_16]
MSKAVKEIVKIDFFIDYLFGLIFNLVMNLTKIEKYLNFKSLLIIDSQIITSLIQQFFHDLHW